MTTSSIREVTLVREFDAPRALVFKAWTEPERLARWWGPHDFTNPVCEVDPRPGGDLRIDMQAPDGSVNSVLGSFTEYVDPERLVLALRAVSPAGKVLTENLTTVAFESIGAKTRLTVHTAVLSIVPEWAAGLDGMEEGWSQSLERLAAEVARP
jgi:uncharacterized protein YndB with AHSA1/START domain